MHLFQNRTIIIDEADSLVAQEIAFDLAKEGINIVLLFERSDLQTLKNDIEQRGSKCLLIQNQLNHATVDKVISEFNQIDILISSLGQKRLKDKSSSICLNMIVKDEFSVIERCLNSIKPLIDYWVIVDTGSTDGISEKIKECLEEIPGELYERKWINFEVNRNEALALARGKGDYILLIDADDFIVPDSSFFFPN